MDFEISEGKGKYAQYFLLLHRCFGQLIVRCLTPFSKVFQLYHSGQCTYLCFPGVILTVFCTIFFPSLLLLSHITIVETKNKRERGMNPVTMTFINPQKEYWPSRGSNQQPVLKPTVLPTELWGSVTTTS